MGERRSTKIDEMISYNILHPAKIYNSDGLNHGTYNGYIRYKCRCEKCKLANREHQRKYRWKRKIELNYLV